MRKTKCFSSEYKLIINLLFSKEKYLDFHCLMRYFFKIEHDIAFIALVILEETHNVRGQMLMVYQ